jgi:cytochrome c5
MLRLAVLFCTQGNQVSTNDKQFATVFVAVLGALAVLAIILFFVAGYLTEDISSYKPEEVILENIKPVGQVNVAAASTRETGSAEAGAGAGEATSGGTATGGAEESAASTGVSLSSEEIYQSKCFGCHGTGAAGAPKVGDAAAWEPRIAKGMDTLLGNATNGLNAMPPKGLCMECSEEDLKGVIEYMVNASQ